MINPIRRHSCTVTLFSQRPQLNRKRMIDSNDQRVGFLLRKHTVCYNSLIRSSKRLSFNVSFSRQLFTVLVYKEKKYFSQNSRTWIMSFQVLQTHPYITGTRRINCINEWKWKVQTQRLITIKFKFMALQKSSDWHTQHFTLLSLYSCFAAPRHFTGHFSETVSCVYWIHRGLFIPSMAYLEVKKKNVGHGK